MRPRCKHHKHGYLSHRCCDWDGLLICVECREFETCSCFRASRWAKKAVLRAIKRMREGRDRSDQAAGKLNSLTPACAFRR